MYQLVLVLLLNIQILVLFWNYLNLLSSYTQYRYCETVCVYILHFSRTCSRHAEDCGCRVTVCTYFLLVIICHSHLVLLASWVSTFSHTLLLVKCHALRYAVIETIIKWKSLCFFVTPQLPLLWPPWYTHWCVDARSSFRTQHNSTPNVTQNINQLCYILKLI